MPRKPRLLILTSTFPRWPGDHEPPFVFELAKRLVERFDITVLAPATSGAKRRESLQGINVIRFRYAPAKLERLAYEGGIPARLRSNRWHWLLLPNFLLAQALATWRLLRKGRFEVIHAHWIVPQGVLAALCRILARSQTRLLVTSHGADVFGFDAPIFRLIKRWVLTKADAVSVVSQAIHDRLSPLVQHHTPIEIAPMGVDLFSRFVPAEISRETNTLVFVGRLVEKKGLDTLLRALPEVVAVRPGVNLLVVGDGPLRRSCENLARGLGVDDKVVFLGSVENSRLPDIFRRSSLAVLPFRSASDGDEEGLGLVTIEAMGCGLPVVVGDVPAVRDVVQHGRNGWLVESTNPGELSKAIERLLSDQTLAKRLATQARQYVLARFDWSVVANNYARLLIRLVGAKSDANFVDGRR